MKKVSGVRFQEIKGFRSGNRRFQVSGVRLNGGVAGKVGSRYKRDASRIQDIAYYRIRSAQRPTLLIRAVPDT